MDERQQVAPPVNIFYSYASEDEKLRHQLEKHLSSLRHRGLISDWHHNKISAGSDRRQSIEGHLENASVILLLISPDFMASDYCYGVEMQRALERHRAGFACVIPILLRPVDWQGTLFASLQSLPRNGKPVTRWSDRDTAFAVIAQEIAEVVATVRNAGGMPPPSESSMAQRVIRDQNCLRFIKRVRALWITGLLAHSLHNATMLTLGLQEVPHAVVNPWSLLVQEMDQLPRPLPPPTHIIEVYDDSEGKLLILGEPGSGKTTLLLQLARDLLIRAEHTADHPLPAIFNLSAWAEKRQPLARWLSEELHDRYQVPHKLGAKWITSDLLLPLLDGLDEVTPAQRTACVAAINQYRQEHSNVPLVVCSRHAEYMAQAGRVMLQRSVLIQPLTAQQIDEYLLSAGEQSAALRTAVHEDAELQELATTPLLLNILMLTYQGQILDDLVTIASPVLRREQLFKRYVARMLQRRGVERRYTQQQTIIWLINLARQMKRHGQTQFYIERLKRNWLHDQGLRFFYRVGAMLVSALFSLLVGWTTLALIGELGAGTLSVLIGVLLFGFIGIFLNIMWPEMPPTEAFVWSWEMVRKKWFILLFLILTGGVVGALDTNTNELFLGIFVGIIFGGLIGVLLSVLDGGLEVMTDMQHIIKPNQEIWRSARHSLIILLVSIIFTIVFMYLSQLGTIFVSLFGLVCVFGIGGLACIQHLTLRILLWRSGQLPWELVVFLDYAAERILLRKVGGGYIFVHRLLLEYFASLEEEH